MRKYKTSLQKRNYMRKYRKTPKNRLYARKYYREYYKRPYAKLAKNLRQRRYRKEHGYPTYDKLGVMNSYLKYKYRISLEEYKTLLMRQKFRCAICRIHTKLLKRRLAVDHNHKTLEIRGLLCNKCNSALGNLSDSISILKSAIKYLQEFK